MYDDLAFKGAGGERRGKCPVQSSDRAELQYSLTGVRSMLDAQKMQGSPSKGAGRDDQGIPGHMSLTPGSIHSRFTNYTISLQTTVHMDARVS